MYTRSEMAHTLAWLWVILRTKESQWKLSPQWKPSSHMQAPVVVLCCLPVALQWKYMQYEEKIYRFILDWHINTKWHFLRAALYVLHMFILLNIHCLTLSKVFWRLQLCADNNESQRSNIAQSKEPKRSTVQGQINNTVGSQWAFCGPFPAWTRHKLNA